MKINKFALALKLLYGIPYTKTAIIMATMKNTFNIFKGEDEPESVVKERLVDKKYKVDKKACQEYMEQRKLENGMHNLTSKYHRKNK
jgi:hypothetical protein